MLKSLPTEVASALLSLSWEEGEVYNSHQEWRKLRKALGLKNAKSKRYRHLIAGLKNKLLLDGVIRGSEGYTFVVCEGGRAKLINRATSPEGPHLFRGDKVDLAPISARDLFPNAPVISVTPPEQPKEQPKEQPTEQILTIHLPESKILLLLKSGHLRLSDILRRF